MTIAIAALAVVAAITFWVLTSTREFVIALLVLSMTFLPRTLAALGENVWHVGMTAPIIAIRTYTVAVILSALVLAVLGRFRWGFGWAYAPFFAYAAFMLIFFWDGTVLRTWAGLVHLGVATLAFVVGASLSSWANPLSADSRSLARWLLISALVQIPIVLLQTVGIQLFPTDSATELYEGDRANGSFGHPSTWGKFVTLSLMILLPLTRAADSGTRRLAFWAIAATIPTVLLSASRANFLAVILTLVLWATFLPTMKNLGKRLLVPAAIGIVILLSLDLWIGRFETGEDGSTRAYLLSVGMRIFGDFWPTGVGPNSYIPYAATVDRTALDGWPVHNTFVFAIDELGILGAALFFWPLIWLLAASIKRFGRLDTSGDFARAYLFTLPGVIFIAWTGWGMLAETLPYWLFVLGVVCGQLRPRPPVETPTVDQRRRLASR